MIKLLGRSTSINVRKVLWLCAEMRLAFEQEPWGDPGWPLTGPDFLALNPNAMVPVLRDGDLVLTESNTIVRYLAGRERRHDLLPVEPADRARVEQWMDWGATDLNGAWRYAYVSLVRRSPAHRDAAAVAASIAEWNRLMTILDGHLQRGGPYAAGASFTVADIVLGLSTHRWFMTPIERPRLAAVEGYYERLSDRPAFLEHGRNGMP